MTHATPTSERWRPVVGAEGFYEVSDQGRVRSLDRVVYAGLGRKRRHEGRVLTPQKIPGGYLRVQMSVDGRISYESVHVLVLRAFIGDPEEGHEGCHNNGQKTDNRLANLRWDTHRNNQLDIVAHGRHHLRNRSHCPYGHPLAGANLHAASLRYGHRRCRACNQAHGLIWRQRRSGRPAVDMQEESDRRYRKIMGDVA